MLKVILFIVGLAVLVSYNNDKTIFSTDFLWRIYHEGQEKGYSKGYALGLSEGSIHTIYLCHDWIPVKGYKAWRQCNMNELLDIEYKQIKGHYYGK
jgi:hypothetical protein